MSLPKPASMTVWEHLDGSRVLVVGSNDDLVIYCDYQHPNDESRDEHLSLEDFLVSYTAVPRLKPPKHWRGMPSAEVRGMNFKLIGASDGEGSA